MILTKEQYEFSAQDHFIEWCTGGPWFNETILRNLHGPIFEEFFVTTCQDRYELMCGLHAYNKENDKSTYATDFGVRIPLPDDSKRVSLVYLCVSINFIYTWINVLAHNFA